MDNVVKLNSVHLDSHLNTKAVHSEIVPVYSDGDYRIIDSTKLLGRQRFGPVASFCVFAIQKLVGMS